MRLLRAAASELVGLFVADWRQTAGIAGILAAGYLATRVLPGAVAGFAVVLGLALHLVHATSSSQAGPGR